MFVFTSNLKVEFPFLRDTDTKSEIIIIFFFLIYGHPIAHY